jgi:hypothetical protein
LGTCRSLGVTVTPFVVYRAFVRAIIDPVRQPRLMSNRPIFPSWASASSWSNSQGRASRPARSRHASDAPGRLPDRSRRAFHGRFLPQERPLSRERDLSITRFLASACLFHFSDRAGRAYGLTPFASDLPCPSRGRALLFVSLGLRLSACAA